MADGDSIDGVADYLTRPFSLDLRSLALLRIGLGTVLVVDLINRGLWLRAHYTDFGVMPRPALLDTVWDSAWLSIHLSSGAFWPTAALFLIAGAFAIALVVGYRTTIASVVSWFLLISLQARNPMVLQGGDIVLRLAMFWAIFLPLGARWSVDAALDPEGEPTGATANRYVSVATLAYVAQLGYIYLFAALLKDSPEWRTEFSAAYYALSLDQFRTPIGDWLWRQPEAVLEVLTMVTFGLEAYGWGLLLAPLLTLPFFERSHAFWRLVAVALFVGMHMSFAVTMRLGLFSYIVSVAWLALLPGWFWEQLADRFSGFGRAIAIEVRQPSSTDRCETAARLARGLFLLPRAKLEVTESPSPDAAPSWTVTDRSGSEHLGPAALVALLEASPVFGPIYRVAQRVADIEPRIRSGWNASSGSTWIREALERGCPIRGYRRRQNLLGAAVAALALMGTFWWNLQTIDDDFRMEQPWRRLAVYLRLDQKWNMFAPFPQKEDGWYVVPGTLRSGEKVSLFQKPHREPPDWDKPGDVSATYPNQRWRKYMMNIWEEQHSDQRLYYGRYLCREWNARHSGPQTLETFDIYFMKELSKPDHRVPEPTKVHLWTHDCFEDPDDDHDPPGTRDE